MKLAIFDIDGVLANEVHRQEFALNKQWMMYFARKNVAADTVWEEGRTVLEVMQASGWTIAYMTGRREDLRLTTQTWLNDNGFPFGILWMKSMYPKQNLAVFKVELLSKIIALQGVDEVRLFDDDPNVIRQVQLAYGNKVGQFCDWHKKPERMVKVAVA